MLISDHCSDLSISCGPLTDITSLGQPTPRVSSRSRLIVPSLWTPASRHISLLAFYRLCKYGVGNSSSIIAIGHHNTMRCSRPERAVLISYLHIFSFFQPISPSQAFSKACVGNVTIVSYHSPVMYQLVEFSPRATPASLSITIIGFTISCLIRVKSECLKSGSPMPECCSRQTRW